MSIPTDQILSRSPLTNMSSFPINVLLIDDQKIVAEALMRMIEDQPDIHLHYCNDPSLAIEMASQIKPTVILQDLAMPDIDGLILVKYMRANPTTRDVPLIVLSSKENPKIKAEAFSLGANDYIVKLPDKEELVARIRYHSAAYIRLLERNQAFKRLEESQKVLNAELAEAAGYVRSLLPLPLNNGIKVDWRFIPSTQLGGDAFGYGALDDDHFVFYLLDVCGHGVGAALLSITLMNVIRTQALQNTDFSDPKSVFEALNESFQMENHHDMYFTMWYGVYEKSTRQLKYSSGGHPPAMLVRKTSNDQMVAIELKAKGMAVGAMVENRFENSLIAINPDDVIYLFSDGVYELTKSDGTMLELKEFKETLASPIEPGIDDLDRIVNFSRGLNGPGPFPDDFSIMKLVFP